MFPYLNSGRIAVPCLELFNCYQVCLPVNFGNVLRHIKDQMEYYFIYGVFKKKIWITTELFKHKELGLTMSTRNV